MKAFCCDSRGSSLSDHASELGRQCLRASLIDLDLTHAEVEVQADLCRMEVGRLARAASFVRTPTCRSQEPNIVLSLLGRKVY
jgi:hypothetical protein